ncbi:hypothetical protein AYI68_g4263 [Smittium mucronatum]|uniref:Uncharacterized protein n=1 Tax=Smittium mucronatum TaxID=133383 RepID=A0A1R0GXP6_9FUNG|nr:hypothetical protein AYI68_g4263 [Smittium mucronatum]
MKKRKRRLEKTITLTTISLSAGLPAAYLREKDPIYQPKDPPLALLQVGRMAEVTRSQELSSFSTNNSSLKLLSSYSEPTSNRINKTRLLPKRGFDRHGSPTNSC